MLESEKMLDTLTLVQGSDAWKEARCGSLGASRFAEAVARTKTGYGASRANLMAELIVERLTGQPVEGFVSEAMRWGAEREPEAVAAYEFLTNITVERVGLIRHPTIAYTHASPDGLVGHDGLVEAKCPQSAAHIDTLITESIPGKYVTQAMWQMACSGRQWVDYISFDPRMPDVMRLFVKRIPRDDGMIGEMEKEAKIFLMELEDRFGKLVDRYMRAAA